MYNFKNLSSFLALILLTFATIGSGSANAGNLSKSFNLITVQDFQLMALYDSGPPDWPDGRTGFHEYMSAPPVGTVNRKGEGPPLAKSRVFGSLADMKAPDKGILRRTAESWHDMRRVRA